MTAFQPDTRVIEPDCTAGAGAGGASDIFLTPSGFNRLR